jgi:hypothetical protein
MHDARHVSSAFGRADGPTDPGRALTLPGSSLSAPRSLRGIEQIQLLSQHDVPTGCVRWAAHKAAICTVR